MMKFKHLFIILGILFLLLFYNLFCYALVNKTIDNKSHLAINNYLKSLYNSNEVKFDFKKAISNKDGSISVFVKVNNVDYYRFIMSLNGSFYNIIDVNKDIPVYVK